MWIYELYNALPEGIKNVWRNHKESLLLRRLKSTKRIYDSGILGELMDTDLYHSQYGQDFFLDKLIFNGKADGFFIDIGANHPCKLSNTLYFENAGWGGMRLNLKMIYVRSGA